MAKRAVLDVDGVVLDCEAGFVAVAAEYLGRPPTKRSNAYDFVDRYGMSDEEVSAIFQAMRSHPLGWGALEPLPGAVQAFRRLKQYGYEIHMATSIHEDIRQLRQDNLRLHGMEPDFIHCAGHHRAGKGEILARIDPVMFVDDRLRHLHEAFFVPEKVFVDRGDDQEGLVVCDQVVRVESLAHWVEDWAQARGYERDIALGRPLAKFC